MPDIIKPTDVDQTREAVAWAFAENKTLEVRGSGSKISLGRTLAEMPVLDLSALSGVTLYEPGELVLTAGAGTPLRDIQKLLSENAQRLAFEPMDMAAVLGGDKGDGTVGGMIACNIAGPRRISAGAARDHILGVKGISGRGESFKSGGRVVKNVTGYDMSKLMTGSYGTLGALTEITLKVLPRPEKAWTLLLLGLDDTAAIKALAQAAGSSHEVSGLAHVPQGRAARSGVSYVRDAGCAVTAIRVEGPGPSVEHRLASLRRELAAFGDMEELHSHNSAGLWQEIRDVSLLTQGTQLWRLSVTPSEGARVVNEIANVIAGVETVYDWAGGLIWLSLPAQDDAGHEIVRASVNNVGGHATLIRADATVRRKVPVFHPQAKPVADLSRRIKEGLDPHGVFNPGRMVDGL
ncbi:MAG: glycolate oxidase subunit GlcE [Alphaproteobacteria bacterium]|jgi:glycolate oxidase FAD binding subunit|nr:glycolate oxidase subunit GlcE [Alphaproteobacteria bacterium]MBT4017928.1 glycolate oxidase subunit GlcE [Alphaproteobacteria bacterium]MBT4965369.1 glycolate oxidase subunit GlcE [Alphaproteobacteria bacterium]MBT5161494.1 glycolate oxidase subunit GlcE [Alphaproteobacteria bacterium]MBT5918933.1 glycolate oxidase subunit GlcE [Alphaproteobacteria bacterium]